MATFGNCIDILAPSHRGYAAADPHTGTLCVTTTDRTGATVYNNASPPGLDMTGIVESPDQDYTNFFGGTSSATPLAAGVAGLVLTMRPTLTRLETQRLLQDTADKIEPGVASYATPSGYSTPMSGIATHAFGRVNALEAVRLAAPAASNGKEGVDAFIRDNRLDWGNTDHASNITLEAARGFIPHSRMIERPDWEKLLAAERHLQFLVAGSTLVGGPRARVVRTSFGSRETAHSPRTVRVPPARECRRSRACGCSSSQGSPWHAEPWHRQALRRHEQELRTDWRLAEASDRELLAGAHARSVCLGE